MAFPSIMKYPDAITVDTQNDCRHFSGNRQAVSEEDVTVSFRQEADCLKVFVTAQTTPLKYLRLRWNIPMPEDAQYLGDAWERGYGTLEWRNMVPERAFPWYFLASKGEDTAGYGVKVRPNSMCFWQCDPNGITLWMDIRNGGNGVLLGGRELECAQIVCLFQKGCTAFETAQQFCKVMCTDPILPPKPVYGSNNWYYAYGMSSQEEILSDTDYLMGLVGPVENPPFMVIDDGWQCMHDESTCNGGPWNCGNSRFPDMPQLAAKIKEKGAKPGIWVRFLLTEDSSIPAEWKFPHRQNCLDPSVPDVLQYVADTVRQIKGWGYELIKHDFSTFDIFGNWGFQMTPFVTEDGWNYQDRSKTSAEIILRFYRTILEAAGEQMLILGCNCVGHLGAGLMHIQRVGDDTSGKIWERTRKMGVNTLAFRLPQHKAFFDIDADCVGIMGTIPWKFNRQWAELLAKSGTPLFVSAKPGVLTDSERQELHEYFLLSSCQQDTAIPLDWMHTTCPQNWKINGEERHFDWYESSGIPQFQV